MGGGNEPTVTYQQAGQLPGWWESTVWPMQAYLQQYLLPGVTGWQGPLTAGLTPWETGAIGTYGSALASLFGQPSIAGQAQTLPQVNLPQQPSWYYLGGYGGNAPVTPGQWPAQWGEVGTGAGGAGVSNQAPAASGGGAGGWPGWPTNDLGNVGGWDWKGTLGQQAGGATPGGGTLTASASAANAAAPEPAAALAQLAGGTPVTGQPVQYTTPGGAGLGGGLFPESQGALGYYLSPQYLDIASDPWLRQAMEQAGAGLRQSYASAGLQYGTPLEDALMRSSADLALGELGRRQNLQTGLGQWGTQFPLAALQSFMPMAGLERETQQADINRWYQELLRQQGQGRSDLMDIWRTGLGMAGQPVGVGQQPGYGIGDFLGQAAQIYLMTQGAGGKGGGSAALSPPLGTWALPSSWGITY